jgi:hypothetical protein
MLDILNRLFSFEHTGQNLEITYEELCVILKLFVFMHKGSILIASSTLDVLFLRLLWSNPKIS